VTVCPRDAATSVGSIKGVQFINISSTSENGIFLAGHEDSMLKDVLFQNVSMSYVESKSSSATLYHDYRPGCQGLIAHSSSGLFMEYASGTSFRNVTFSWASNVSWSLPIEFTPTKVGRIHFVDFSSSTDS
jgi:hypothetical protein